MTGQHYVVGFMFTKPGGRVALTRKERPAWQRGFWNGIGGKVVAGAESAAEAMVREAGEETGVVTSVANWRLICTLRDPNYVELDCYSYVGPQAGRAHTKTDEEVMLFDVAAVPNLRTLQSVQWLVPLAMDASLSAPAVIPFVSPQPEREGKSAAPILPRSEALHRIDLLRAEADDLRRQALALRATHDREDREVAEDLARRADELMADANALALSNKLEFACTP